MILRYFSFPERSRRAHIRVFKALYEARKLTHERLRADADRGRQSERICRADRAFTDLSDHADRCLNFYLPQTWQGGTEEQKPRGDSTW